MLSDSGSSYPGLRRNFSHTRRRDASRPDFTFVFDTHGFDMSTFDDQLAKVAKPGFIAALDQSGGSTPKALRLYGIAEDSYSGDDAMFNLVHEMRTRIMTSPAFNGEKVMGTILFENTMDRQIAGKDTGDYLWQEKQIVPFLKVDKGLADEGM